MQIMGTRYFDINMIFCLLSHILISFYCILNELSAKYYSLCTKVRLRTCRWLGNINIFVHIIIIIHRVSEEVTAWGLLQKGAEMFTFFGSQEGVTAFWFYVQ